MFQIYEYLHDYNIDYVTEGHKHCQPGWIQMKCPFCTGHEGYHLGYNELSGVLNCWRCGVHHISELLQYFHSQSDWRVILSQYLDNKPYSAKQITSTLNEPRKKEIEMPKSFLPITNYSAHTRSCKYLKKRNFDWKALATKWKLCSSSPVGPYAFRIIAPVYYKNKIISYQGRDYTEKQAEKYKACRMEDEAVHHKHVLYGIDEAVGNTVVVVEGVTDVWRLGPGSVATFGIKYTNWQIKELKRFKKIVVFFDADPQAKKQSRKLVTEIKSIYPDKEVSQAHAPTSDPASMSQELADNVMNSIFS